MSDVPARRAPLPPLGMRAAREVQVSDGMTSQSPEFDPYLRWLGIRDPQRPPNHYRLLGLDPFESDPEVIAEAADRQMGHIRTHQTGPHAELSQKVLNELARAKVCLLNARRKAAYDEMLQEQLAERARQVTPPEGLITLNPATLNPQIVNPNPPQPGAFGGGFVPTTAPAALTVGGVVNGGSARKTKPTHLKVRLTVEDGPQKGTEFEFCERGTFTVGRSKNANLSLPGDQSLSRLHFCVKVNPPCCILKNLSETHGTKLNGKQISETVLKDGDVISGGQDTRIRVSIQPYAPSSES